MRIWVDAHLSPAIAAWINRTFDGLEATSVGALGLRDAKDPKIFEEAKKAAVVMMSKDDDFIHLIKQKGTPPRLIWITCGNTSNARMRELLSAALPKTVELLKSGENIVEIRDKEI